MAEFKLPMQYQSVIKIPKNIKIGSGESVPEDFSTLYEYPAYFTYLMVYMC